MSVVYVHTPVFAAEYLSSRFGNPIVLPKNASISISIKLAVCSNVFDNMPGHTVAGKQKIGLKLAHKAFKKTIPSQIYSSQKEVIAQQLHQYAMEQIVSEIALLVVYNKCTIEAAIKTTCDKHKLTTDYETVRKMYARQRKAILNR